MNASNVAGEKYTNAKQIMVYFFGVYALFIGCDSMLCNAMLCAAKRSHHIMVASQEKEKRINHDGVSKCSAPTKI
jgi:hypothetical protein